MLVPLLKFIAVELANAIMNQEQFERYTQGLTLLSNESRQASHAAAMRSEQNKLTDKLIRQTVFCDGSSASSTRAWVDDVSLAYGRIGQTCIIEIASSTVTGSLRNLPQGVIWN